MATQARGTGQSSFQIRRATAADAEICGRICFEAFGALADYHRFPRDFPSPEFPLRVLSMMFSHPGFFCVVAEQDGKPIGSNCLDERSLIAGIGPITVDPQVQNRAVGRQLMQAVLDRVAEKNFAGVRLVQAAYHNRSLSLYAKLGFVVREPLSCMQGPAILKPAPGYRVRPAQPEDLAACNDLCFRIHGHIPLRRVAGCHPARRGCRRGVARQHHRVCFDHCIFRSCGGRIQRRPASAAFRSARVSGSGHPRSKP